MQFKNRKEAGALLAQQLTQYRGTDAVVLALPRGGVVLGAEVARALGLPLDIAVSRKIGHPDNPEYAICAVDETGERVCAEEAKTLDPRWLEAEAERGREEAARRVALYRGGRKPVELGGKTVILVDDGIATGLTMRLALRSVEKAGPKKLVVAVPVAPAESLTTLWQAGADELVILMPLEFFAGSVGEHYQDFPQVSDDEVMRLLGVK